jgi:hypothetical protein
MLIAIGVCAWFMVMVIVLVLFAINKREDDE